MGLDIVVLISDHTLDPEHITLLGFCSKIAGKDGKIKCGFSAIIRVELKDGTAHEDIGYGFADNVRDKVSPSIALTTFSSAEIFPTNLFSTKGLLIP